MIYRAMTIDTNSGRQLKKIVTLAVLVCFLAGLFFSQTYFLAHLNHAHDHNGVGGGCAVCARIQNAENLIKQTGIAGGSSPAFIDLLFITAFLFCISVVSEFQTPVSLKIRMNK